jgi:hypothetical protein
MVPPAATPNQVQVLIYDRQAPLRRIASATNLPDRGPLMNPSIPLTGREHQ